MAGGNSSTAPAPAPPSPTPRCTLSLRASQRPGERGTIAWAAGGRTLLLTPRRAGGGGGGSGVHLLRAEVAFSAAAAGYGLSVNGGGGGVGWGSSSSGGGGGGGGAGNGARARAAEVPAVPSLSVLSADGSGSASTMAVTIDGLLVCGPRSAAAVLAGSLEGEEGEGEEEAASALSLPLTGGSGAAGAAQKRPPASAPTPAPAASAPPGGSGALAWRAPPPSPHYTPVRAPLRLLAASPNGRKAVVAGSAGFAVYSAARGGGWHVFPRPAEEADFFVAAVAWLGDGGLLALCRPGGGGEGGAGGAYALRAYPSTGFDAGSVLGSTPVVLPHGATVVGLFTA